MQSNNPQLECIFLAFKTPIGKNPRGRSGSATCAAPLGEGVDGPFVGEEAEIERPHEPRGGQGDAGGGTADVLFQLEDISIYRVEGST